MKKISIIVPIYNSETYLRRCLISLINQKYNNLEIILVNDGSTDNSLSICKEYEKKDSRIKLINQLNKGVAHTRNIGLDVATGDYITFVDSDDFIDKNMYSELIENIDSCDIAVCRYVILKNDSRIYTNYKYNNDIIEKEDIIPLFLQGDVLTAHLWNKLYKKELFNNIRFKNYNMLEDLDVMYRILDKCEKVKYLKKDYYYYNYNENSLSQKYSISMVQDFCECINNMHNYFSGKKEYEKYVVYNKVMTNCTLFEIIASSKLSKKEKEMFNKNYIEFKKSLKLINKEMYNKFSKKQKIKNAILNLSRGLFYRLIIIMKGMKSK